MCLVWEAYITTLQTTQSFYKLNITNYTIYTLKATIELLKQPLQTTQYMLLQTWVACTVCSL